MKQTHLIWVSILANLVTNNNMLTLNGVCDCNFVLLWTSITAFVIALPKRRLDDGERIQGELAKCRRQGNFSYFAVDYFWGSALILKFVSF